MNKLQHKALQGLVKKDGLGGINTDFQTFTSRLFPNSIIAKFSELTTTDDGGIFEENSYYEIEESGNVNTEIDKEMDMKGKALFRRSLKEIE